VIDTLVEPDAPVVRHHLEHLADLVKNAAPAPELDAGEERELENVFGGSRAGRETFWSVRGRRGTEAAMMEAAVFEWLMSSIGRPDIKWRTDGRIVCRAFVPEAVVLAGLRVAEALIDQQDE